MSDLAVSISPEAPTTTSRSFLGHAKLIGFFTLISRLLGLVREMVAGHYMGTSLVASAFTVAFTIPNLFRKLFGEGALSAAFIPLYAQALRQEKGSGFRVRGSENAETASSLLSEPRTLNPEPSTANDFAAAGVNLLCAILLGITVVGEAILLAMIFFGGSMWPDLMLTLKFTAIMLPYVLLICGGAFLSGILQVHHRFGAPAAAPIILNVCHIAVLFIGAKLIHLNTSTPKEAALQMQTTLAYWLCFFVLVAGVLQIAILLPALRETGFHFRFVRNFYTPMVRRMLTLSIPVALGAGVLQLSVVLDKGIAIGLMQRLVHDNLVTHFSLLGHSIRFPMEMGAPRRLEVAQYLYQFPLAIFATALATAIFPGLSADALDKDREKFRAALRHGIQATFWEGLPASVGLIIVREPVIRLLFQHGQLTAHDAELISRSLLFYAAGIWAFSLLQIINRAYYAIHDTMTPFRMAALNIIINLIVEIPLLWWLGEPAMAVGTFVSFAIQAIVMLFMLDRRLGGIGLKQLIGPALKIAAGTLVMGISLWAIKLTPIYPSGHGRMVWATQMMMLIAIGAGIYFAMCEALKVDMLRELMPRRLTRRAKRSGA